MVLKNLEQELATVHRLYNQTLDRNWGFVPITLEDLEFAAADLKSILRPEMAMIAEKDGEPVGFSLAFPNINEFMWRARSSKGLMRILKFLWLLKTSNPKEARLAILGVHPDYRNKGIAPVFYYESLTRASHVYDGGEMSWVEESNEEMSKAIRLLGAKRYKTYRIYEKPLEATV